MTITNRLTLYFQLALGLVLIGFSVVMYSLASWHLPRKQIEICGPRWICWLPRLRSTRMTLNGSHSNAEVTLGDSSAIQLPGGRRYAMRRGI